MKVCSILLGSCFAISVFAGDKPAASAPAPGAADTLQLAALRNPVWTSRDNLRDPSVLKTPQGYLVFYSRFAAERSEWGNPVNWSIACAFTKDFVHFENDHDVSPTGFASPGDVIQWHGRWLLPYQSYPAPPVRLCYSESTDLEHWSAPKFFLEEAAQLPWNNQHRVIDATFVEDAGVLHCFFIGTDVRDAASNAPGNRANLMGHAITRDPQLEDWEILTRDTPLIGRSERAPDGVENTMVIRTGDHWTMLYSEGLDEQHLAVAVSPNLYDWTMQGAVDLPPQKWYGLRYGAPFVWRDGSRWMMILMGESKQERTTLGLLTSDDGTHWTPLPERD